MKTKQLIKIALMVVLGTTTMACCGGHKHQEKKAETASCSKTKEPYKKKFTNADFYKNGKLSPEIALKSYVDMLEYYGVPYTEFMKKNLWITDFGLGDFENVGMAGIFWINDSTHNYFGHEIYLLPGQMIVEHKHMPTQFAAKFESWQIRNGSAYNFGIGDATPNPPALPASQKEFITVSHFIPMAVGDIASLTQLEAKHFLIAGSEGTIITEYGSYHDGNGLRFTNPKVVFTDILTANK